MRVTNERWPEDRFLDVRRQVLAQWPTGAQVDLGEAVAYHRTLDASRSAAVCLTQAKAEGRVLMQPRAGVAVLDEQIALLRELESRGGPDILPTTIDSFTRDLRFAESEAAIQESRQTGRSMLNGFPGAVYGVPGCRRVVEAVQRPLVVRTAAPDARLNAEVMLAAGYTGHSHGPMADLAYSKHSRIDEIIELWQYVDRLAAYYEERGCPINREHYIPLCSVTPPSLQLAVTILDGLLQVAQGATHTTLGYGQNGCLLQDVAAVRAMALLAAEYFPRLGYPDAKISTALHQWMGGFPSDPSEAMALIALGAAAAALSGVTMVLVKTPAEAIGVPTVSDNVQGLTITKTIIESLMGQEYPDGPALEREIRTIEIETRSILDWVVAMGNGNLVAGISDAFATGVIDIPFSPNVHNAGKVMPARDDTGAVRYLDHGHLPLPREAIEYNRETISRRAAREGRPPGYAMTRDDVYRFVGGRVAERVGRDLSNGMTDRGAPGPAI